MSEGECLEKAGLRRIMIHDVRDTYATLRISKGDNIADVSKQLGHASVQITWDVYYPWIPGKKESEVDELDNIPAPTCTLYAPNQEKSTYQKTDKCLISLVAGPGFEPGTFGL